jgi:hypothetical protein
VSKGSSRVGLGKRQPVVLHERPQLQYERNRGGGASHLLGQFTTQRANRQLCVAPLTYRYQPNPPARADDDRPRRRRCATRRASPLGRREFHVCLAEPDGLRPLRGGAEEGDPVETLEDPSAIPVLNAFAWCVNSAESANTMVYNYGY